MVMGIGDFFSSIVQKVKEFWNSLDLEAWSAKIGGTSGEAVQAAVYFGLFFAVGFLFKKYFKFFFVCIIVSIILIKVLEYNGYVQIDMLAIKKVVGLGPEGDVNTLFTNCFDWIKEHILVFASSFVGFLVGCKLG